MLLPAAFLEQLTNALSASLLWVYVLMLLLALLAAATMLWFPRTEWQAKEPGVAIPHEVPVTDSL